MRRFFILMLAVAAGVAAAPAPASETWYAERITAGDTPLRVEHFWSKGRQVRMETVIRSQPLITLVKGELYTVIDPVKRRGIAIRRAPGAVRYDREHPDERPFASDAALIIAEGAEKVGTEETPGGSSTHYRLSDRRGRREVWMTNSEPSLPLRVIRYDRTTAGTVRQDFVDWARELDLPDRFFEPDPDITLEQLDYAEYLRRAGDESSYLLPVLMRELLHGRS